MGMQGDFYQLLKEQGYQLGASAVAGESRDFMTATTNQAANAAAQTTMDYNQRQLMELSIQGTEVSQNMARAAGTQQFITKQTQMARNATAAAQSQAATATFSAYIFIFTQTAQAQAILDVQATHTAQAYASLIAYSLTATPWAAIQSDIVRTRNEAKRRALWGEFVVTPLKVILVTLVVLLLIVGGVMAYMRLIPVLELRLRTISRYNDRPTLLVDGMIVDPDPNYRQLTQPEVHLLKHPQLPSDETPLHTKELKVGDTIHILGHLTEFDQTVDSLEIDHKKILSAVPATEVAIKVEEIVRKGDIVYKVVEDH